MTRSSHFGVDNCREASGRPYGGHVMPDPSLNDEQLEAEIKLVGELVLAASQSEAPLSDDEIDEILGLPHESDAPDGAEAPDPVGDPAVTAAGKPAAASSDDS